MNKSYVPPSKRTASVVQESFDKAFPVLIKTTKPNVDAGWSNVSNKLKVENQPTVVAPNATQVVHDKISDKDIYAFMVFPDCAGYLRKVHAAQNMSQKRYSKYGLLYDSDSDEEDIEARTFAYTSDSASDNDDAYELTGSESVASSEE